MRHGIFRLDFLAMTSDTSETLNELRNRLLNGMLLGTAIVAVPAVVISLWRSVYLGWKPLMAVHLILVAMLWIFWLFRDRLTYQWRSIGLLVVFWVAGMGGFIQLGPAAGSSIFLIMFPFAGFLLFRERVGWWLVVCLVVSISLVGILASQHVLKFNIDYHVYAHEPLSWLNLVWAISSFGIILAYIGWNMVHGIRGQYQSTRELAERQRKIADNVPGAIYEYLLRPDGSSCFPFSSPGIKAIYGVEPEQVKEDATQVFKVLHPDDFRHCVENIEQSASNLTEWHDEYRVIHPTKGVIWVEGHATPERKDNGDIVWHGLITDATERKKAEQVKQDFISVVSHELRTPLTSIQGSLGLLSGGAGGELPGKSQELVDLAYRNVTQLGSLINDLLDLEKIAAGKSEFTFTRQSLMPLVEKALEANKGYADQYAVNFVITQQIDEGMVSTDAGRFQQVLANLLSNAAKFSPKGSDVEIAVTRVGENFRITVTDHGEGIPDEFHDKIFERFSQADPSNTRKKGGTGLGLAISRDIIERLHGQVGFNSVKDNNTTFWLELPVETN